MHKLLSSVTLTAGILLSLNACGSSSQQDRLIGFDIFEKVRAVSRRPSNFTAETPHAIIVFGLKSINYKFANNPNVVFRGFDPETGIHIRKISNAVAPLALVSKRLEDIEESAFADGPQLIYGAAVLDPGHYILEQHWDNKNASIYDPGHIGHRFNRAAPSFEAIAGKIHYLGEFEMIDEENNTPFRDHNNGSVSFNGLRLINKDLQKAEEYMQGFPNIEVAPEVIDFQLVGFRCRGNHDGYKPENCRNHSITPE